MYGGQAGADPPRVLEAMRLPDHQIRSLLLEPGDVAFTHSNLLHASAPNLSDKWRRNLIVAFNSRGNEPLAHIKPTIQPDYRPIDIVGDDALLRTGCTPLDPTREDFLEQQRSENHVESVSASASKESAERDEL